MPIRRRWLVLLPGLLAIVANGVPFITHPRPFLDIPAGIFTLVASALSVGLGIRAVRKRDKLGWWAICLGIAALLLGAFLPALFVVRESAHRRAKVFVLILTMRRPIEQPDIERRDDEVAW